MLRKLIKNNMNISQLIQFINQLMFNLKEMDTIMVETQNQLDLNGALSQQRHGFLDQVVTQELISQFHQDKRMLKRDKKNKNFILPSILFTNRLMLKLQNHNN